MNGSEATKPEHHWRLAVEGSPLGICLVNNQGLVTYVSPRYTAITGYLLEDMATPEEYSEKAYPDPKLRDRMMADFRDFRLHGPVGEVRYRESRILCGDGVIRQIMFRSLKMEDGAVVITVEDVTIRRQTEDRYRTLADQSPVGIALSNADGRFSYLNPVFVETFGYTMDEVPDDRIWFEQVYPDPEFREKAQKNWAAALKHTRPGLVHEDEYPVRAADGKLKQVRFRIVNLQDGSLLVLCEDMTEIRKAEEERQVLEEQLFQAQKMEAVGTLAAGIAHEINSPMQYLAANLQFLDEAFERLVELARAKDPAGAKSPADLPFLIKEIPEALKASLGGLERIAEVVTAMRQLSYPSGSENEEFDLNRVVEQALIICGNELSRNIEMIFKPADNLPPAAGNRNQFSQAVINLIINACQALSSTRDAASGRDRVTITTRRAEGWLEVEVADNGPGIDPRIRDRVFEPFFTTKQVGQGTGLGLYLAHKAVVEQMSGRIRLDTGLGQGAAFTLSLPLNPNLKQKESRT